MTVETGLSYDKDYIKQFSTEKNEPDWMRDLRIQALNQTESLEMPKPDKTDITRWNFSNFKLDTPAPEKIDNLDSLPEAIQDFIDKEDTQKNLLIQRDHTMAYGTLDKELEDKGVIFTDIFTALQKHSDLVKKYYMQGAVSVDEHKLTALHAALMNGGAFIYVPKGVQLEDPLQIIFWQENPNAALFNHVLIVAEESSSLTYVENYFSQNDEEETVANIVTEVIAKDNAQISFGGVDNFAAGTTTYVNRRGSVYRDASIEWALGQMNEGNTVSENNTNLYGDNSSSYAKAVSVGRGKQSQNFKAQITHHGTFTEANILQHGVMLDKARSIFNGIGKIESGASKTFANQDSRVLMLSEKARGDANPILLIDDNDVEAGHAASVGRVDPLQLYYLMSRGISQHEAERLIIHGFLEPVVSQLPIEAVKTQLRQVIERKVDS